MSDDKVESGQEQTEPQENMPSPEFSNVSGDSQDSQSTAGGQDDAGLEARIMAEVDKRLQSTKDVRLRKMQEQLDAQGGLLGALDGVIPADVLTQYAPAIKRKEYERKVDELYQQGQPSSSPASGGNQEWEKTQKHVQDIFVEAGLAKDDNVFNSPDYIAFYKMHNGNFESGMDMLAKAGKYVAGSKNPAKVVSDAALAQSAGGGKVDADEASDSAKYTEDMLAARGKPRELQAIKAAARLKGVDVDNIGFR